ncbi:PRC-barrel domain-containing protein [Paracoccus bogoriensis]|uniref:PRC-barrel domain-containing protein n=1 Tax=Paracoccus bogoriensis TaxID=242065 RepID=UPI001C670861|nr:PRC-barrel domain-containing protein [Paracoccus bogoriensis]MBW7056244.1 PRC-barrel domain-containing protein [Paracoccus bogoriensis]
MRKLMLTTALVLPFSVAAFAQDATVPADDPAMQPAGDATVPADPMATEPMATDPVADPMADPMTDDAAMDANDAAMDAGAEANMTAAASEKVVQQQAPNELRLDWITGTNVEAPDGTNIGSIKDLILDGDTGELKAAIIGVGGFLGIGQKDIALPWDELTINYDAREITANLTREEADAAPEYVFRDRENAPSADMTPVGSDPAMAPANDPAMQPMPGETAPAPAN